MSDNMRALLTEAREFVESQRAYFHSPKAWANSRPGNLLDRIDCELDLSGEPTAETPGEAAAVAELAGDTCSAKCQEGACHESD